jgi:hypothetical protein
MNKIMELVDLYAQEVKDFGHCAPNSRFSTLLAEVSRVEQEIEEAQRLKNLLFVCRQDRDALKAERLERERQEPVAQAWSEGYRAGIYDERTSEANIGIAGMNMKVEPARKNPYSTTSGAGGVPMTLAQAHLLWCEARANNNSPTDAAIELIQLVESHHKIGVKP